MCREYVRVSPPLRTICLAQPSFAEITQDGSRFRQKLGVKMRASQSQAPMTGRTRYWNPIRPGHRKLHGPNSIVSDGGHVSPEEGSREEPTSNNGGVANLSKNSPTLHRPCSKLFEASLAHRTVSHCAP
jgi:hypothetical protein